MILKSLDDKGIKLLCKCDVCGKEIKKYKSQLTNLKYQFCDRKCSFIAKNKGSAQEFVGSWC